MWAHELCVFGFWAVGPCMWLLCGLDVNRSLVLLRSRRSFCRYHTLGANGACSDSFRPMVPVNLTPRNLAAGLVKTGSARGIAALRFSQGGQVLPVPCSLSFQECVLPRDTAVARHRHPKPFQAFKLGAVPSVAQTARSTAEHPFAANSLLPATSSIGMSPVSSTFRRLETA